MGIKTIAGFRATRNTRLDHSLGLVTRVGGGHGSIGTSEYHPLIVVDPAVSLVAGLTCRWDGSAKSQDSRALKRDAKWPHLPRAL